MAKRELTTLEYVVLGLVSLAPQSGYSITSFFEDGSYSWSASPGSIYPMLKRLEAQAVVVGDLEMEYETRPRKIYTLTELGAKLLDDWLQEVPKMRPFYQELEVAQLRFQFMEKRLSKATILKWLKHYLDAVHYASSVERIYTQPIRQAMEENSANYSLHSQLLMESYLMQINTLRTWLELVYARLQVSYSQEQKS